MRPKNQQARDQLPTLLRRHPGAKASQLAQWTQTSQPTISRILAAAGDDVIAIGAGPRRRYFQRRALRGSPGTLPLYAVDSQGQAKQVGTLLLIEPQGTVLDVAAMGWPLEAEFSDGVWPGLAYPLQDMRPQGFLGRSFARSLALDLGVSPNPTDWQDDDVLYILAQRGADTSGNLILGDVALQRWLQSKTAIDQVIPAQQIEQAYAQKANQASALGAVGSSAAGEFPKFTTVRELAGSQTPHVIVKFSGSENSGAVQRWADLLVCEHLAMETIRGCRGIHSATSRILRIDGRTMLEVERFDRHGNFGRSALCSLETLDAVLLVKSSGDWAILGELMHEQGWISDESVRQMRLIWLFGKLIANTDMHKGNLSFVPGLPMRVAPVYDMLPMMYAPLAGGELPTPPYTPALPTPQVRGLWLEACAAALAFWLSASVDERISAGFRKTCNDNHAELRRLQAVA
ncbi:MAG: type II toxin-antitoxin system HipA family toxin YjjJ [Comamonadaceae bacterium]